MLFLASASLVSALALYNEQVNFGWPVFHAGLLFSGVCHLLTASWALPAGGRLARQADLFIGFGYTAVLLLVGLLTFAALEGVPPVVFAEGEGPGVISRIVLLLSAAMFALASLLLAAKARGRRSAFESRYGLSLALIGIGVIGVMLSPEVGGLAGWVGRAAQYLGGLFLLHGVIVAGRKTGDWDATLRDALEQCEQRFRALAEATAEGVVISEDGIITEANDQFAQILGYQRNELLGKPVASILPGRQTTLELTGTEGTVEHAMIRQDGRQILVETHGRVLERHGRRIGFLAVRNITERRQQEDFFRAANKRVVDILESISDGVVSLDRDWNYTYVNRAAAESLRTTPEELIGQHFWERWPPTRNLSTGKMLPQCLAEGKPVHYEEYYPPLDSWFDCHCYPSAEGLSLFFTDITERKRAEEALREVEKANERNLARLNAIVTHMTEGLVIFDPQGDLLEMNPAALEIHGFTSVDTIRQHLEELGQVFEFADLDGNILPPDQWPIGRVLKGETFSAYEVRVRRLEIDKAWIASYGGTPVYNEEGNMQLAIVTLRDITSHKKAEQALRESEQRLRTVLETSRDGIHQFDVRQNRHVFVSSSTEDLTGFTRKELQGMPLGKMVGRVHPDDRVRVRHYFKQITAGQIPREPVEYRWQIKNGAYRWFSDNRGILRDRNGQVVSLIGVSRDITVRKEQEQALARSREELEKRVEERTAELKQRADQLARLTSELTLTEQRERGRLAQVLHDDLQQLLVGAKYRLTLAARKLPEKDQEGLERVEQLLNESIRASRSLTIELSPPILHEGGLGAGLRWLARWAEEKFGLTVHFAIAEDAVAEREDVRILMFQAVRELLTNISKYAKVSEAFLDLARDGDERIRVTVIDHGVGFNPGRINDGQHNTNGGFGVFSIRERLKLLGGELRIDSAPGKGARITLIAPVRETVAALEPDEKDRPKLAQGPADGARLVRRVDTGDGRIRLLLVDDHAVMRQGLSLLLNVEKDLEIVGEASDGQEAVEKARELRPDVILMDFSMPRLDGVQATRIIHSEQPETRIVGLSMYKEEERADAMMEAGAVAYVTKSGESDVLLQIIRKAAAKVPPR